MHLKHINILFLFYFIFIISLAICEEETAQDHNLGTPNLKNQRKQIINLNIPELKQNDNNHEAVNFQVEGDEKLVKEAENEESFSFKKLMSNFVNKEGLRDLKQELLSEKAEHENEEARSNDNISKTNNLLGKTLNLKSFKNFRDEFINELKNPSFESKDHTSKQKDLRNKESVTISTKDGSPLAAKLPQSPIQEKVPNAKEKEKILSDWKKKLLNIANRNDLNVLKKSLLEESVSSDSSGSEADVKDDLINNFKKVLSDSVIQKEGKILGSNLISNILSSESNKLENGEVKDDSLNGLKKILSEKMIQKGVKGLKEGMLDTLLNLDSKQENSSHELENLSSNIDNKENDEGSSDYVNSNLLGTNLQKSDESKEAIDLANELKSEATDDIATKEENGINEDISNNLSNLETKQIESKNDLEKDAVDKTNQINNSNIETESQESLLSSTSEKSKAEEASDDDIFSGLKRAALNKLNNNNIKSLTDGVIGNMLSSGNKNSKNAESEDALDDIVDKVSNFLNADKLKSFRDDIVSTLTNPVDPENPEENKDDEDLITDLKEMFSNIYKQAKGENLNQLSENGVSKSKLTPRPKDDLLSRITREFISISNQTIVNENNSDNPQIQITEGNDQNESIDDLFFNEVKQFLNNNPIQQKLKEATEQHILPSWNRYKEMIDEMAKATNEGEIYSEDVIDDSLNEFGSKDRFYTTLNQEELEKLYQSQNDEKKMEGELGPNEGSSATMLSGLSISDVIIVEKSPGVLNRINNKCFSSRVKQWSCPAGSFCMAPNLEVECTLGFYCPPNTFEPSFCCGGYYCPTPSEMILCPEGHFCQEGSIKPRRCYFGRCPAGSKSIRKYEIFVFFIFFLLSIWIGNILRERQLNFKRLEYEQKFDTLMKEGSSLSLIERENFDAKISSDSKNFTKFDITFDNLCLKLPSGVEIMKGVSGSLHSGRTCAIMGPSGAGKTTLISLLTGKAKKTDGKIYINGVEKNLAAYRKLVGFVPQEDVMLRKLTPEEVLMHSAMMRLPTELSDEQKATKVLEYIEYLGLRHVMHSLIGDEEDRGISGGQRKRVNIGMELVAEPAILFLDEPTSGLDSSTSVEVCSLLKKIARDKRLTIAAVIHSPSPTAFNEFDDLLLLGKGGRLIYHGAVSDAPQYFDLIGFTCPEMCSPSDYYMDVATGKIRNSKIPDFSVPDLYTLWERYENCQRTGNDFNLEAFIEPRAYLSRNYGQNRLSIPSPTLSNYSSEEGYTLPGTPSYEDSNDKHKEVTCMQSTCIPTWRQFLNRIIGPFLKHFIILSVDIFTWTSSVWAELRDSLIELFYFFRGGRNDPVRNTPGFFKVFLLCLNRAFIQIFRPLIGFMSDQLLHFGCGLFISIAAQNSVFLGPLPDIICNVTSPMLVPKCKRPIIDQAAQIGNFLSWGIGFAGISVGAGTFGNERVVYWREVSSGLSALPYFLAKSLADIPRIIIASLMFTGSLIAVYSNLASFMQIYWIVASLYYWGFSLGYLISAVVRREKSSLVGVVVALFWAIALSGVQPTLRNIKNDWPPNATWLFDISAPRWAIAAFYIAETEARGYMDPDKIGQRHFGYIDDTYYGNLLKVVCIGMSVQLLAFFAFKLANREKMQ